MPRSRVRRFVRRAARALRLPPRDLFTTLHAVAVLVVVELLIRWVPLPRLSRMLGVGVNLQPGRRRCRADARRRVACPSSPAARLHVEGRRRLAVQQRTLLAPALVGGHLIRDLHPAVRLGVAGVGDTLMAHAWLEIDDRPLETVTDYRLFQRAPIEAAG